MKLWRYGQPVEVLGDRYYLEGMLGSGGMADVCLAFDEYEQRHVAIKVLKADAVADQEMLNRFVKEAGQVVGFQHPHILRVYDQTRVELIPNATTPTGNDSFLFYIVMEYAAGGDLQKRMTPSEPYYSISAAFTIFRQICGAVQYAHKHGIIHRDIKPLNILFRKPRTGSEEAVLSDFGLAVQIEASHHTFAEAGSFSYMAPEQFRGQAEPASDIFALGVTLYQLLTGELPFQREMQHFDQIFAGKEPEPLPPSQLNPTLPRILDDITLQALDSDPAYRYRSAAEFWNVIRSGLEAATLPSEQQPGQLRKNANPALPSHPSVLRASRPKAPLPQIDEDDEAGQTNPLPRMAQQPLVLHASTTNTEDMSSSRTIMAHRSAKIQKNRKSSTPSLSHWRSPRVLIATTGVAGLLVLATIILTVILPLFATATITLIPKSVSETKDFTVPANQIQAHQISATASEQTNTVNTTGTLPEAHAMGKLTFINQGTQDITIPTTTIVGKSGVAVSFTGPIVVKAVNPTFITVPGFAVEIGPGGNIPAFDIDEHCCVPDNQIVVKNDAFSGGRLGTPNDQVQQSDITQAAQDLVSTQTRQEQDMLQSQVKSTEQVASSSNKCSPTITPNHPVGTQAKTVTVTVSVTCTEVVYDAASAQTTTTNLLTQKATQELGAAYRLANHVVIKNMTLINNATQATFSAQGVWVYAFSADRLNQLARVCAGKSPAAAHALLLNQPGISNVQISTTSTLPSADHIQMKVQAL